MKKYLILAVVLVLTGCKTTEENRASNVRKGNARIALFKECMNISVDIKRQGDDDVSDIVDSCANQSYHMTNHIE